MKFDNRPMPNGTTRRDSTERWLAIDAQPRPLDLVGDTPQAPRFVVKHCGHPTAHRPWYVDGADFPTLVAFTHKATAEKYAAAVLAYGEKRAMQMFGWGE